MALINLSGFTVNFEYKKIKNINISIKRDLKIYVSAPFGTPLINVEKFISSKKDWIYKSLKKLASIKKTFPQDISQGSLYPLWGKLYPISFDDNAAVLFIKGDNPALELSNIYRRELKFMSPRYFEKWSKKLNVSFKEWRIKNMKTRFGSCNYRDKRIWLNLKLAAFDIKCLELVIVHELCHLIEPSHSPKFYSLMDLYLPSWKETQNALRSYDIR